MPEFHPGKYFEQAVDWLLAHFGWLFDAVSTALNGLYDAVYAVLGAPHPLLMAGILAVVMLWLRGLLPGALAFAGFALVDAFGLWDEAMQTLSLVLAAGAITLVIAVPLGIWAARRRSVSALLRPVLDVMQTMPVFVYLIPGVMFFSVGVPAGLIATIVFAMPPGVRMTELGIRQVDGELVEAAEAFGTHPRNTLTRVQLPLALPTIMAGVNQVIMLTLSMVVVAGMVGGGGLGEKVYGAVTQVQIGQGVESGVAVVVLAMYLDRMTGALGRQVSPLGRRAAAKAAAAAGRMRLAHYRPATPVAVVGVVVLGLVAGGMNIVGSEEEASASSSTTNVGEGREITMGLIPWDEGIATSYLWKEVLEQRGFEPKLEQLDLGPLFSGVAQGDIDFQTDAWLPTTHKPYWDKYGKDSVDLGGWYGPTSLELTVPDYVEGIDSLADLKGQGEKFDGKIIGIEPSTGEMRILKDKVLKEYGLEGEYEVVSSSTSSMLAELKRSIAKKEPVVVTLWSPHWAYNAHPLKKLEDPKGAFGEGEEIHSTASKDFVKREPVVTQWLKDFQLTEKQLTSLENEIQGAGEGREQEAVRTWIEDNPGIVEKMAPVPGQTKDGKDAGKSVKIAYAPFDEAVASTYLWANILEDRGYEPEVEQLDAGPLYAGMAQGQIDFQTDSWLPTTHEHYWKKYGSKLEDLGDWYGPTSLELSVPEYVEGIDSLADLKGKADLFGGKITGIENSTGEMKILKEKVLPAYGLDDEYEVTSSSSSTMFAAVERAVKREEPVLATTWSPHWIYSEHPLKKLKDPKGAFGEGDQIRSNGRKGFSKDFPELAGWLKDFEMSEKDLGSLEAAINAGGEGKEKESVRKWMDARPGLVDKLAPVS